MMKNTRIFDIDDRKMMFNFDSFNKLFVSWVNEQKKDESKKWTIGKCEEELALKCNVEQSSVHKWRNRENGPSDIEKIYDIATVFKVDYKLLLKENDKNKVEVIEVEGYRIDSVKRIYDAIVEFLFEFENSGGFVLLEEFEYKCICDKQFQVMEFVDRKHDKVRLVLEKEYIFLYNTDIYDQLETYIYNDLVDVYDGKWGHDYWGHAALNGQLTVREEYFKAMSKLNNIVCAYIK